MDEPQKLAAIDDLSPATMSKQLATLESLGLGAEAESPKFDFKPILAASIKHFWIVILCALGALALAWSYLQKAPTIYESVVVIQIEKRIRSLSADGGDDLVSNDRIQTMLRSFSSRLLMTRVAKAIEEKHPDEFSRQFSGVPQAVDDLLKNYSASPEPGTRLISVRYRSPDPEFARMVVTILVEQFKKLALDQRVEAAQENINFLNSEKVRLQTALRQSEEAQNEYTRKLGSISVEGGTNLVASELGAVSTALSSAKAALVNIEADYDQIRNAKDTRSLMALTSITSSSAVADRAQAVNEMSRAIVRLQTRYKEKHPKMVELRSSLERAKADLQASIAEAADTISLTLDATRDKVRRLEEQKNALELKTIEVKQLAIESRVLERQIEADRLSYETVLKRLNEENSQARSEPVSIQMVDEASAAYPVAPDRQKILLGAGLGGAAFGIAIIALIVITDKSIRSVAQAEQASGVPILASIPHVAAPNLISRREQPACPTPYLDDKRGMVGEAFRSLRVSLLLNTATAQSNSLLVTSAIPEEGKSMTALNLAIAMAQHGAKTLLVDADLRRSVVGTALVRTRAACGLADYLSSGARLRDLLQDTEVANLFSVNAGSPSREPAEALSQAERFQEFLRECNLLFDWIIFDSAPVLAVSDTLSIAQFLPLCCVVARHGRTPIEALKTACEELRRFRCTPTGVVYNDVPAGAFKGRFRYYSQYYHAPETPPERMLPSRADAKQV